jgi:hypothetical protein
MWHKYFTQKGVSMANHPTIKVGALARIIAQSARGVRTDLEEQEGGFTADAGALIRDVGKHRALVAMEMRREVIDPFLDLNTLAGFVRPGKKG